MDLFGEEETIEDTAEKLTSFEPVEEFTHPRSMSKLLGHEDAEQQLIELFNSGRMPHGLILNGIKGIGKATLAYKFARFLFKNPPADPNQNSMFDDIGAGEQLNTLDAPTDDPIFRKVASGGHPDLLTIERLYDATKNKTAETLAVSELRKVEPFLRMTSSDGGWRVVIIDDADTMNRNAQNALLKILEEPPKNTLIILITHRLGSLIPTIRSRARMMNIKNLKAHTMNELLNIKGHNLADHQMEIITSMADGSFGKTLEVLEEGGLDSFAQITAILNEGRNIDWRGVHHLADQTARAGQEQAYKNLTQTLIWLYKTLAFAKARGQGLSPAALNEEPLTLILRNSSLAQLLEICEKLTSHFDMTARGNLDKKQAVLGAFQIITA